VIRCTLEALERVADRDLITGLDAAGAVAWRHSGHDVLRAVAAWQAELAARGVQPGDRVAIDLPRGPELLPAHLAALASGATVVPINPALSPSERERVFERAELRTLIEPHDTPRTRAVSSPQLVDTPDEAALLIFTSGTTGEPKGVPHTLAGLEANLDGLARTWALTESDRLFHTLPCHHVHGLVLALYGSARMGHEIVMAERFDAELALDMLERYRATVFMGVPTMVHRMIQAETHPNLEHMRVFISGSAPLSEADFAAFEARFGHRPLERYGLTETLIVSSNPLEGERRPGSVGHALPETEIRLAADSEIEVRGPAVLSGYWHAPEATEEAFHDDFFRTGDLGELDPDGYLRICGRKKELIIVGGSNVLPGEVERGLGVHTDIEELAVAGVPDADRGECVVAFVVTQAEANRENVEVALREAATENLAPYKRPRSYCFVPTLPRNQMGKIDRKALQRIGQKPD